MKTLNLVILEGYVGSPLTDKEFSNGTRCVNLVVKTREFFGSKGDRKVEKNYHNCILWNTIGDEALNILKKGDAVRIMGKLKTKKFDKDGDIQYKTEVVVNEWTKLADNTQEIEKDED